METRALAASALAHDGVLVALFAGFASAHARRPATLAGHLLSASSVPPTPAAAPAPEPAAQLQPDQTPNRPKDEVVKIPKTKHSEPSRPKRESAENTTGPATVGSSGLSAEVGVDDANFEF